MSKKLIIFAGPNGSGKSTLYERVLKHDLPDLYINADEIKKELGLSDLEAAEEAERRRWSAIESGDSFVFETVLSTGRHIYSGTGGVYLCCLACLNCPIKQWCTITHLKLQF